MARKPQPRRTQSQPSLTEQLGDRLRGMRNLAIALSAIGAVFFGLWSGIVKVGLDPVLSSSFTAYQAEISRKIVEADAALQREMQIKLDEQGIKIRGEIEPVKQDIGQLRRQLRGFQIENLEAQESQVIWSQMPQLLANLAGIEERLKQIPDDRQLIGRKQEVQNAVKNIERRLESIQQRLKTLREQL